MQRPIEISDLSVSYSGVPALKNISMTVDEGDFLGIIGPNGAGKSTLFACMLGLNTEYDGTVQIFGEDVRKTKEPLKKLGYVPQMIHFERNFPITVKEVVKMGMWHNLKEERVDEVMEELGIQELAKKRIGELSGGQQQRVFIAKAIINEPELLVMDEPVTGIDRASVDMFYEILKHLNTEHGITIVWSSHDIEAVDRLAQQVVCLNKKLHFHGTAKQFFTDEKLVNMYSEISMCLRTKECSDTDTNVKLYKKEISNNIK